MSTTTLPAPLTLRRAVPRAPAAAAAPVAPPALRDRVLARLAAEAAWDPATSNVCVDGDTVVLQGLVRHAGARLATRRIAAAVPGVTRVWDARVLPRD